MRITSVLFLTIFLLLFQENVSLGQDTDSSKVSISGALEPLFFFKNALKLDAEMQRSGSQFSYIITPEFYSGGTIDGGNLFRSYKGDYIKGFGIGLFQKYKFKALSGLYLSYGMTYRDLKIKYSDQGFFSYKSNNLTYYEYGNFTDHLKINSWLINSAIGVQTVYKNGIITDFYFGIGYKKSSRDSEYQNYRKYDQSPASFGFTGLVPVIGLKMGFQFKLR